MIALFILASLAADPALAALRADDQRVAAIAWRLQTSNVDLCATTEPVAGLAVHSLSQYSPDLRARAAAQFALGDRPGIAAVAPNSAADRAGLKPGDTILAIGGVATAAVDPDRSGYAPVAATEAMLEAGLRTPPLVLRIARDGVARDVSLTGDPGCASRVEIVPGGRLNAEADGQYVQISGAMLAFAASDDELAVVVAHELAHNILGHRIRLDRAHVSRGLLAGLGAGGAQLRRTEFEADRLGVWLMARAQFDLDAAIPFWSRYARRMGPGFLSDGTHPSWKERMRRVAEAIEMVRLQRASGQPLIPPELAASLPASQGPKPR